MHAYRWRCRSACGSCWHILWSCGATTWPECLPCCLSWNMCFRALVRLVRLSSGLYHCCFFSTVTLFRVENVLYKYHEVGKVWHKTELVKKIHSFIFACAKLKCCLCFELLKPLSAIPAALATCQLNYLYLMCNWHMMHLVTILKSDWKWNEILDTFWMWRVA